ncbi:branched-chain amino acid ABC transporter permease [Halarchaeum nitratireducens]|uniref:Branched-chain amino acid ABC transporter permease n=1 Tax=Halarchaeum nitratireducens TaxID=489913 RepID=A0A830G7V6_9EURY|nr:MULTISPECIES: branched-chain amino acid ABC transporter permease [Halarchaeum]MBP2250086.1 branched-chain amino acid transport system permease protein [Halarchaeum solikamskense]GGN08582.1 branched-chain amino acid ABC transporter permease [Halarchaeum nitratireducens]
MSRDSTAGVLERVGAIDLGVWQVPLGLLAVAVLLRPVVSHDLMLGYPQVASSFLIWMIIVASFNLLMGYTGLISFGHAMFMGIGTYSVAIALSSLAVPFLLAAPLGILFSAGVAYLIGRLIAHKGEIYFAMLTLAFAKSAHFVANYNPGGLTGGTTGLADGTTPAWIETSRGFTYVVLGGFRIDWYWAVAAVFVVGLLLLWQLVRSPFGRTLVAVRENEALARSMGVNVRRYKVWAFTFAAAFAALGGVLLEINNQGATLSELSIVTSGNIIIMAVLGGANYFFGPLAGVFVWMFVEEYLTDFHTLVLPLTEVPLLRIELTGVLAYWQFFLGLLFVVAVLVSPREGVLGLAKATVARLSARIRGESE